MLRLLLEQNGAMFNRVQIPLSHYDVVDDLNIGNLRHTILIHIRVWRDRCRLTNVRYRLRQVADIHHAVLRDIARWIRLAHLLSRHRPRVRDLDLHP